MNELKLNYGDVPAGFQHCAVRECPRAAECLRQRVYELCGEYPDVINLVNPAYARRAGSECRFFQPVQTMRYAYGFKNLLGMLPAQMSDELHRYLHRALGHTQYYRARRGELQFDDEDQQAVIDFLHEHGVDLTEPFDHYEEHIVFPSLKSNA